MSRLRRRRSRIVAPYPIAWGHNQQTGVTNRGGAGGYFDSLDLPLTSPPEPIRVPPSPRIGRVLHPEHKYVCAECSGWNICACNHVGMIVHV